MPRENKKEVYFSYCETCKHKDKTEDEWPCEECMFIFAREDSHKPQHYESEEQANG